MSRLVPEYKEEARSRILGAAQAAFSEKGYDQTTMDDVAQKIGVSKGALYLYFASKEELFAKLTESRQSALRQMLRDSLKDGDLLQCSQAFFDTAMDTQDVYSIGLTFEVISEGARNEALRTILLKDYEKRLRILGEFLEEQKRKGLIRDDVDLGLLALTLSALFNGLMISKILGIDRDEIERTWMGALNIIYASPVQADFVSEASSINSAANEQPD